MKLLIILGFVVLYAAAAPTTYLIREVVNEQVVAANKPESVKILKQINQLNDDGSYTFGFEAADGSYRKEVRDVLGHVTGRYGYIDANGQLHELEYVSGQLSGKTVGFQIKSAKIPAPVAPKPVDQKQLDYQYSSVDDNGDGQPDAGVKVVQTPTVVRYVEQVPTVQKYVIQQVKSTVVPTSVVSVAPPAVDQKALDFQYSSVDDNGDGQPDAPLSVVRLEEVPVVVQQQQQQTVVPVVLGKKSTGVDQKQLDYKYHSVDDNEDGKPDAPLSVVRLEEAPVVVQQPLQTVVPVVLSKTSTTVDQKHLDYQYHSVDDNEDGHPDAPLSVVRLEKVPVVVQQPLKSVVPVVLGKTSTGVNQKHLDYKYHSVDDNGDGHPDTPLSVVRLEEVPVVVQQQQQTVVPVVLSKTSATVDQKHLDYKYHSVDDNGDGQPDAPLSVVRLEEVPVVVQQQQQQTVVPVVLSKISTGVNQKHLDYKYHSVDDNEDGQPDAPLSVVRLEEVPVVVQQQQQTVVPVVLGKSSTTVDQKHLDYQYHSVDDNGDGHPDAPLSVVRLEEVPVVIQQQQQTVVPVDLGKTSTGVDQKHLDYKYHSVDDNEDGQPDAPLSVVRLEEVPVVVQQPLQTVVPVVLSKTSTTVDQKHLDYKYHSVDDNEDGQPDAPVGKVVHTTLVQKVVPVSVASSSYTTVDQKALDYRYSSVDDNEDGIPDSAEVRVQNPTYVRYEPAPAVVRVVQTVVRPEIIGLRTVYSNSPVGQFIRDLRYHSVDTDEDGIPDEAIEVSGLPVVVSRII